MLVRDIGERPRTQGVVLDRLPGIPLHHGHVLVRRGVKDDGWFVQSEQLKQAISLADISDARFETLAGEGVPQVTVYLEEGIFRALEQNHEPRAEAADLPTDFRTDAPTSAGNHDHAVSEFLGDREIVQNHCVSPQKIFDRYISDARQVELATN